MNILMNNPNVSDSYIFSSMGFSAFFSFVYPSSKSFVNGFVTDIPFLNQHLDIMSGFHSADYVNKVFDHYRIDLIVMPLTRTKFFSFLNQSSDWQLVYEDKLLVAYKKLE